MKKGLKWYWWLAISFGILVVGMAACGDLAETPVAETTKVETIVEECDYSDWRTLKEKDDEIISQAASGFMITSEMIEAAITLDVAKMERKVAEMEKMTDKVNQLGVERQTILNKLGY